MKNADEALKTAELTLEKYKKNKTLVPEADLKGKYKIPFQKLKHQLADELSEYLKAYCLSGLLVKEPKDKLVEKINQSFIQNDIGKRVGCAAFKNFDIEEIKSVAEEWKNTVHGIWMEYFNEHICLYTYGQCYAEDNPSTPLIYNDLVDKFWDEDTGRWIDREKPPGDAILIFISGGKGNVCKADHAE